MDFGSCGNNSCSGGRPITSDGIKLERNLTPSGSCSDFIKLEPIDHYTKMILQQQHPHVSEPDFEPLTRARSNTWPQPRPEDPPILSLSCPPPLPENEILAGSGLLPGGFPKKSTSRRNAWGNLSYADLITQAIQSAPDKRLTLSQIYDWMVTNVLYFKDKGDSNSSAGWKNSIRHNLSLHNRFMRVQNEGTGKSSWWMLNPDAKPGKAARRRATSMETSKFEKKRGRIKKKIEAMRNGTGSILDTPSPSSSLSEGLDLFPESPHVHSFNLSPSDHRGRTNSNASSCGGRLSPILGDDLQQHDTQITGLTPWDYRGYVAAASYANSPSSLDRFGTDQLAVGFSNTMKLHESTTPGTNFDQYHPQSFHHQSSPQNYGGDHHNGGYRHVSPPSIPATIKTERIDPHVLNRIYGTSSYIPCGQSAFVSTTPTNPLLQLVHSTPIGGGTAPGELDINLDFMDPNSFECNVEEVLETEPGILREGLDFDFGPTSGPNGAANHHNGTLLGKYENGDINGMKVNKSSPSSLFLYNSVTNVPCSNPPMMSNSTSPGSGGATFQSPTVHHHHHHPSESNGRQQWTSVHH